MIDSARTEPRVGIAPDSWGVWNPIDDAQPSPRQYLRRNEISFAEAVKQGVMIEPPHGVPDYGPVLTNAAEANPGIFAIIEQDMYPVGDFGWQSPSGRASTSRPAVVPHASAETPPRYFKLRRTE